jgi:hypothetical protein
MGWTPRTPPPISQAFSGFGRLNKSCPGRRSVDEATPPVDKAKYFQIVAAEFGSGSVLGRRHGRQAESTFPGGRDDRVDPTRTHRNLARTGGSATRGNYRCSFLEVAISDRAGAGLVPPVGGADEVIAAGHGLLIAQSIDCGAAAQAHAGAAAANDAEAHYCSGGPPIDL